MSSAASGSNDTRLLIAGVLAFLVLLVYLAVAFARTHVTVTPMTPTISGPTNKFAPFIPSNSHLALVPSGTGGLAVRATPAGVGNFGALVPTLVAMPHPGLRLVVGFWLRGTPQGRIGIEIDEFRSEKSPKLVETTVPATARWQHYLFKRRVRGRWLGIGMFVYRRASSARAKTSFALRDLFLRTR